MKSSQAGVGEQSTTPAIIPPIIIANPQPTHVHPRKISFPNPTLRRIASEPNTAEEKEEVSELHLDAIPEDSHRDSPGLQINIVSSSPTQFTINTKSPAGINRLHTPRTIQTQSPESQQFLTPNFQIGISTTPIPPSEDSPASGMQNVQINIGTHTSSHKKKHKSRRTPRPEDSEKKYADTTASSQGTNNSVPEWPIDIDESPVTSFIAQPGLSIQEINQPFLQDTFTTIPLEAEEKPHHEVPLVAPTPVIDQNWGHMCINFTYLMLLIFLASPSAVNAFCAPSGVKPTEMDQKWWDEMDTLTRVHSCVNAIFNLGVNLYVLRDNIPKALDEFKESFGKCFNSPKDFIGNTGSMLSSFVAAVANGAISYMAFEKAGSGAATLFGAASIIQNFINRYPFVKKASRIFRGFFNADVRFQKRAVSQLRNLRQEHVDSINRLIQRKGYKLNLKDCDILMNRIGKRLAKLPLDQIFNEKTSKELAAEYALTLVTTLFTLTMASTAFETFTEKGFAGFHTGAKVLGSSALDDLNRTQEFFIGLVAGLVSATSYAHNAYNFSAILTPVIKDLCQDTLTALKGLASHPGTTLKDTYQNPERLFRDFELALGLTANVFASGAMVTVGRSVVENPDGIFQTSTFTFPEYVAVFPTLNGVGGATINTTSTINQLLKKEKANHPTFDNFLTFSDEKRWSPATISNLRSVSAFAPAPTVKLPPLVHEGYIPLAGEPAAQEQQSKSRCLIM